MKRSPMAAVALVALLFLAGCSVGYQPAPEPPEPSEPPTGDHLGYYDGYWYNDTFDVDAADGLTDAETEAIVARAMARVQLLRGLPFHDDVEIELVTREEFHEEFGEIFATDPPDGARTLDNAQYEALFLVGSETDVADVRQANRGDVVLGFYQPGVERVVIVSGNDPATLDDEITLAHELLHALQDQHFDLASVVGESTLDSTNARNGLVEGDAVFVERKYERNCETGEWQCVEVGDGHQPARPGPSFHFGVYFVDFFPYAEGPSFVEHHRDRGGWESVDAMYDDPPTASAELIYPETYDSDAYGEATLEDRNSSEWERVTAQDAPDHAVIGQPGLATMFAYTTYADDRSGVIDRSAFVNSGSDGIDPTRPFTYDVSYAEGWYADRLHAYEDGDDVAYVWNVTFDDAANATEFHGGYERVFEFWGGQLVETRDDADVWSFDDSEEFDGAVWVEHEGRTVTVVKAPTADDLGDVYAPAADREHRRQLAIPGAGPR